MSVHIMARDPDGHAWILNYDEDSWLPLDSKDNDKEFRLDRLANITIHHSNGTYLYTFAGEYSPIGGGK